MQYDLGLTHEDHMEANLLPLPSCPWDKLQCSRKSSTNPVCVFFCQSFSLLDSNSSHHPWNSILWRFCRICHTLHFCRLLLSVRLPMTTWANGLLLVLSYLQSIWFYWIIYDMCSSLSFSTSLCLICYWMEISCNIKAWQTGKSSLNFT